MPGSDWPPRPKCLALIGYLLGSLFLFCGTTAIRPGQPSSGFISASRVHLIDRCFLFKALFQILPSGSSEELVFCEFGGPGLRRQRETVFW